MANAKQAIDPPAFIQLAAHPLRWQLLAELAKSDLRVHELVVRLGQPQNLVSYHLRQLRDGGLVSVVRSSFDRRQGYYRLDLERCAAALAESGAALHPALRPGAAMALQPRPELPSVLFVCTGNSARSPIAEALLRHRANGSVFVTSAGTRPKDAIHPTALRVLREGFGIEIDGQRPRHLDELSSRRFDHVITLCDRARESCPEFESRPRRAHWSIPDPAAAGGETSHRQFERTAAEIDARIRYLLPVLATA